MGYGSFRILFLDRAQIDVPKNRNEREGFTMKKRIITLIALLLVSCITLSGCSGDGIKENSTETINEETVTETVAPTDTNIGSAIDSLFSEKYELDVNGETITLDVGNHSGYFKKNNIFRYSDLANDCGWHIPS